MSMTEFTGQLWRILAAPIAQMRIVVDAWERGERPDLDSLEIIAALARQL